MATNKAYRNHLNSMDDLITPYEATRAGFVSLALERNKQASPTVVEARNLKAIASRAKTPTDLLNILGIWPALLTAAGVSNKAMKHMLPQDKKEAVDGLIKNFLEPAGSDFVEELVYRFLLTRGDALGGSMRNIAGKLAQKKLTRTIIGTLVLAGKDFHLLSSQTKSWILGKREDADIESYVKGLSWMVNKSGRILIFNRRIPIVNNNSIDLSLLNCTFQDFSNPKRQIAILSSSSSYVALGELKGGIDPAGADEHWKTARTALSRIRDSFSEKEHSPFTFYIGAAIQKNMAEEIWNQLKTGMIHNAANLTNANQLASLCHWLCEI